MTHRGEGLADASVLKTQHTMSDNYPDPPRTEWAELALLSEADDPEDYRDLHGIVQDEENWRRLQDYLVVPFETYDDFPDPGPFDGAMARAEDINVDFYWDADLKDWRPKNTGTEENRVPGTTYREGIDVVEGKAESLEAENAEIGGVPIRRIETKTDDDEQNGQIEFGALQRKKYGVRFSAVRVTDPGLKMMAEDDGTAVDDIYYFREEGGRVEDSDGVDLMEVSSDCGAKGWMIFDNRGPETLGYRFTFKSDISPVRGSVVGDMATTGSAESSTNPIDTLRLESPQLDEPGTEIELWEVL